MELSGIMIFFIVFFILTCLCACCKGKYDTGTVAAPPVQVIGYVGPPPESQTMIPPMNASQPPIHPGMVAMQQHATGTGMYPPPPAAAATQPMPGFNPSMGAPYPPQQTAAPYPPQNTAPYPPQQSPYPPQNMAPYPTSQSPQMMPMPMPMPATNPGAPMLPVQATMDPPSYDQAVTGEYGRQAAFNPHFSSGKQ